MRNDRRACGTREETAQREAESEDRQRMQQTGDEEEHNCHKPADWEERPVGNSEQNTDDSHYDAIKCEPRKPLRVKSHKLSIVHVKKHMQILQNIKQH